MPMTDLPKFKTQEAVDFVIVGSGSAGGIIAKELSTAGFDVVVLEQGPYRKAAEFTHDEVDVILNRSLLGGGPKVSGQTFRDDANKVAQQPLRPPAGYAQPVGGSSVHFTANFWRLRESDFKEKSLWGAIEGTNFADWPITYEELEPYYTKVDWEIGVSGAPGPFDSYRSKPFPMPPMEINSSGALLEKAAMSLGLHAQAEPLAILTRAHNGRAPCIKCGYCMFFGCEVGAKSSTLAAMIPLAEASGHCEIRPECAVFRLETGANGKISEVLYYDPEGNEQSQKAKAVIVCANGAETSRLLLLSENPQHPDGLSNSSGFVGRNLMFNSHSVSSGLFEHQLNEHKGVQVTRIIHDFYEADPSRGFYGGGGIDARAFLSATPVLHAITSLPPGTPRWGAQFKDTIGHSMTRTMTLATGSTSLAQDSNNITLDPTHTDQWGRPAVRVTYKDHPDDLAIATFLQDRSMELLEAAGAEQSWRWPVSSQTGGNHLLGTCRMGNDPGTSVVDRYHRSHEIKNLFICDGSSMVTSGRGQPTMTIMALAFRAAEHIGRAAASGDI
jgi:choline dehydrogenase-like flavoprotein